MHRIRNASTSWTTFTPIAALLVLVPTFSLGLPSWAIVVAIPLLVGTILAAVEHAEAIGHRTGEPFGSLVLALAVTVIEVGLIVALMSSGGEQAATLARDTVFAAVMICCNGIVGLSLLAGTPAGSVTTFRAEGCRAALATVVTLTTLSLVLPSFTESRPGPEFTPFQLGFAATVSLVVWGLYVLEQTVRHRPFFLDDDPQDGGGASSAVAEPAHGHADAAERPMGVSLALLLVALVGVVGLAKVQSPLIERGVEGADLPHALVGVVIACIVLLPEAITAIRAARGGEQQRAFNLAYGSAIASIGLTIPVLAVLSPWLPVGLQIGLEPRHVVLLAATFVLGTLTVIPGQATRLQGAIHVVVLAAFIALTINP